MTLMRRNISNSERGDLIELDADYSLTDELLVDSGFENFVIPQGTYNVEYNGNEAFFTF